MSTFASEGSNPSEDEDGPVCVAVGAQSILCSHRLMAIDAKTMELLTLHKITPNKTDRLCYNHQRLYMETCHLSLLGHCKIKQTRVETQRVTESIHRKFAHLGLQIGHRICGNCRQADPQIFTQSSSNTSTHCAPTQLSGQSLSHVPTAPMFSPPSPNHSPSQPASTQSMASTVPATPTCSQPSSNYSPANQSSSSPTSSPATQESIYSFVKELQKEIDELRMVKRKLQQEVSRLKTKRNKREVEEEQMEKMSTQERKEYFTYMHMRECISLKTWDTLKAFPVSAKEIKKTKEKWVEKLPQVQTETVDELRIDYLPFGECLKSELKILLSNQPLLSGTRIKVKISGDGRSLGRCSSVVLSLSFPQHIKPQSDVSHELDCIALDIIELN